MQGETPPAFTNIASATGVGTIKYEWQSRTYATAFVNVTGLSYNTVYTETTAINTTTFIEELRLALLEEKEYSNIVRY